MPPADDGPKSLVLKKGLYLSGQVYKTAEKVMTYMLLGSPACC
jgi:hypothetical protein